MNLVFFLPASENAPNSTKWIHKYTLKHPMLAASDRATRLWSV